MGSNDVVLVVDMLNSWDYEGSANVMVDAEAAVDAINRIRKSERFKVVFANDLDGGFHGSREVAFALAMAGTRPDLVAPLEPDPAEDFVHKGQHSAFYGTPLAHLLDVCEAGRVILTGQVTEQCILYTALDAHVRGYEVVVVTDAVLAENVRLGEAALEMIEKNMGGRLVRASELL